MLACNWVDERKCANLLRGLIRLLDLGIESNQVYPMLKAILAQEWRDGKMNVGSRLNDEGCLRNEREAGIEELSERFQSTSRKLNNRASVYI